MNEALMAKVASIQRSVQRARQELERAGGGLQDDLTRQDAAVLNVLRACETSIDLANSMVRELRIGIPQSARDSFRLLAESGKLPLDLAGRLQRMVGFRNIAVHRYRDLDLGILENVIRNDLEDLLRFTDLVARLV